ncbi:hypothetical protein [Zhihengliuella sp.]|uniref:hypothetical protein n=1 Tax=Zhihengliuella sp. TaxID=1954483 RepID=UPI002810A6B1|nr:hypothetical protein [Zhihengliuella sp.]
MGEHDWHYPAPTCGDATWTRLAELVAGGEYLLHGSQTPGLDVLEPNAPLDFSPDAFSKATAVFATEDPTWAMAYALRSPARRRFLNACFYRGGSAGDWSERRIFLSYAVGDDGHPTLSPGVVYVLGRDAFTRMPSYTDPALGLITECQFVSTAPVRVVTEISVGPANLPIEPHFHDDDVVSERSARRPDGFPWLD